MTGTNTLTKRNRDIPGNMHLTEKANSLVFEYSWFKPKYVISIIAAPVFIYFLIQSDYIYGSFTQLTVPVVLFLGLGLFVCYYTLAKLLNTSQIEVNDHEILVKHGPLPLIRNLDLGKKDVKQLYVTRHRIGHRYYVYAVTYQVNVILANDDVITLVKGLDTPEQGRFIENKMEDFLGITDIEVAGELEKD